MSIYNPNGTTFLPGQNGFPQTPEDDSHVYASIEDTLVYTHLLRKGEELGVYGESGTFRPVTGPQEQRYSQKPPVSKSTSADNMEVGVYQQYPLSSQQGPPLPQRPRSNIQTSVNNEIYQTKDPEEEDSATLGAREDPEGGD